MLVTSHKARSRVLALRASGLSRREIGELWGVGSTRVLHLERQARRRAGLPPPIIVPRRGWPVLVQEHIVELRDAGMTLREIAELAEIARERIRQIEGRTRRRFRHEELLRSIFGDKRKRCSPKSCPHCLHAPGSRGLPIYALPYTVMNPVCCQCGASPLPTTPPQRAKRKRG